MAWLKVNGIDVAPIVMAGNPPKGERRDIGEQAVAASGAMRTTRQVRKRDISFDTVPLSGADAHAWEALLAGEGHVWSFDTSLYSSKGLAPSTLGSVVLSSEQYVFGGKSAKIDNVAANTVFTSVWTYAATVAFRYAVSPAAFTHYVIRSDGAKWVNGTRNDAASTPFLTLQSTGFTFVGSGTEKRFWDDVVAFPFLMPTSWPAQLWSAPIDAYPNTPYLTVYGDMVREASTRRMLGTVSEAAVMMGGKDGSFQRDLRKLAVELREA